MFSDNLQVARVLLVFLKFHYKMTSCHEIRELLIEKPYFKKPFQIDLNTCN